MKKITLILFGMMLAAGVVFAQVQVSGVVTDAADGQPLPGVSVVLKGANVSSATDANGRYTINVAGDATLVFSFIGMKTQEEAVGGRTVINVALETEAKQLEEVIVVAYGAIKREAKTGAVVAVSGDKISETPVVSLDKALTGKMAGVSITASSGQPGASTDIRIRGTSSINAGNNPLWVIDGIPVMSGNATDFLNTGNVMASINPNDIESITVLKDAAAASVYGSRAANGVILVTTKSGKEGQAKFTVRAKYGTSWLANDNGFGIMSAEQLLAYQRDAVRNAGLDPDNPTGTYYRPQELLSRPLTNWMEHFTRMGNIQEYEVNASGGNARGKYYSSVDYNKAEGIYYGIDFQKFTARLNADYKLTDALETGVRINAAYVEGNDVPMQNLYYSNPAFAGMMILPWTPAYNPDGTHNVDIPENSNSNPRATAEYDDQFGKQYQILGNIYLQWKPWKGITVKTTNAIEGIFGEGRRYWSPETNEGQATLQTTTNRYIQLTTSNTVSYDNVFFDDHTVRLLAGQEAMSRKENYYYISAPGVDPAIPYPQTAPAAGVEGEYGYAARALLSFFGILDYNWQSKYFLQASVRADGSSLFGSSNKWGTFWSVGGSWNINQEDFMKDFSFINLLKLRVSYGVNGNNNILPYRAYGVYAATQYNGVTGMLPSRPENENLSWEKNHTWNVGLDFSLFDRLHGNFDVYDRLTKDMLLDKNVPQTTGFSVNFMNIGSLRNKGVELQLNGDIIKTKDILWNIGANIAFNNTEILELGDNEEIAYVDDSRLRHVVGKSLYTFRLLDYYGVDPTNGDALFRTADGTLTKDYNQAQYVYPASPEPKFTGGFNTSFSWKGISFDAFFEFKGGNHVMIIERRYLESDGNQMTQNQVNTALNYWKQPGDTGVNPKPVAGNSTNSYSFSTTRFLQKGDYLRLKDLTISYTLPKRIVEQAKLNSVKFYVSAQNLYTFHDVDFWDPERGVTGIGYGVYPMSKSFVGGVEISF
ncbi:MAG: TonB-dependent receptor [Prevotellaceae bacterium]|jgi:TonB-linked SusC/RagA family outer membrane protein|nr:TonB-dependent receptor [Prevotellaceae bacterium]